MSSPCRCGGHRGGELFFVNGEEREVSETGKGWQGKGDGGGGSAMGEEWVQCEACKTPSTISAGSLGKKKCTCLNLWGGAKKYQRQ